MDFIAKLISETHSFDNSEINRKLHKSTVISSIQENFPDCGLKAWEI